MGPVDRRVTQTKKRLGEAIIALVQEKPYEEITVQEIADRADVGRATFYMHYRDKQALLLETLSAEYLSLREKLLAMQDDPSRPIPARMLFEHIGQHADIYRVLLVRVGRTDVYFHTRDVIAQFVRIQISRLTKSPQRTKLDIPTDLIAAHIAGSLLNLVVWWLMEEQPLPPERMESIFQRLIGEGLFRMLGVERMDPE